MGEKKEAHAPESAMGATLTSTLLSSVCGIATPEPLTAVVTADPHTTTTANRWTDGQTDRRTDRQKTQNEKKANEDAASSSAPQRKCSGVSYRARARVCVCVTAFLREKKCKKKKEQPPETGLTDLTDIEGNEREFFTAVVGL